MSAETPLSKQFKALKESCVEALDISTTTTIKPLAVMEKMTAWNNCDIAQVNASVFRAIYDNNIEAFTKLPDRDWLLKTSSPVTVGSIDVSHAYSLANNTDQDLATVILYRLFKCVETADVLTEGELEPVTKNATALRDIINGTGVPPGPSGVAFSQVMKNAGPIISGLLPAIQSLMEGDSFKKIMEKAVPSNTDPTKPPNVESIVKGTMDALQSPEGQEIFNKVGGIIGSVQGVGK